MKKRTLGLLLLLAMLITAIPVSIPAEAASARSAEEGYFNLHDLYVSNGLVAHFTTFSADAASVSLDGGTWTDILSGAKATLGNKRYWQRRPNGSVGFDILYGCLESDGSVTTTLDTTVPLATDRYSSAASSAYALTRLDLGISLLPKDDFTVEYVARYNPVYVANHDGTIAKNPDGTPMEYFVKMGHGLKNANLAGAQDALGFLSSWATERDGTYGMTLNARGSVLWMFTENLPTSWKDGDAWIGYAPDGTGGMRGDFQVKDGVHTYAISRDETLKETGGARTVSAYYSLVRDAALYKKSVTLSTATSAAGRTYYDKDDTGAFYLSSQQPTDFYAIRIYNRPLSYEELEKNRLADLLLYYDLKIPTELFAQETLMDIIYRKVKEAGFADDAFEKATLHSELQATIDGEYLRAGFASLYAAPENLKELFTSYVPGTVDIEQGKWYSLLSRNMATLGHADRWSFGANGAIGFNTFCGMIDAAGSYNRESAGNNFSDTSARLQFGITMLPEDDFTVEYLAMYKPLYVYDVNATDHIARDGDGTPYETYDFDQSGGIGYQLERTPFDQLGWFSSYSAQIDGVGGKPWGDIPRGYLLWYFDCPTWYYNPKGETGWNHNQNILVDGRRRIIEDVAYWMPMKDLGLNISTDPYQQNNVVRLYTITLDETLTVDGGGKRTTTGLFSLYRDNTLYNSNKGDLNTTATETVHPGVGKFVYTDIDTEFDDCDFFLSATRPTDFFTVRIYDKVLSADEMAQNRAADLLYYYGVDIPNGLNTQPALLAAIGKEQASMPFTRDGAEFAANKALLEQTLAGHSKKVNVVVDGKTVETITLIGDQLTLPMTVTGKQAIAWEISDVEGRRKPGDTVSVSNGTTIYPILFALPKTVINPTVRMTEKEEELGIRFGATVSRSDYGKLKELYGVSNISFGLLVAPASYVTFAGAFTREALTSYAATSKASEKHGYIQIDVPGFVVEDDETYLIKGCIYDFKEITRKKNPSFAVVAFFDVDTNGDGTVDLTFYGNYNPLANAKVKETLAGAKSGFNDQQKAWIDNLLSRFGA